MRLLLPVSDDFEDIEVMTIVDVLRRANIQIDLVGVPYSTITSKSGIKVMVDRKLIEIRPEEYEGIVLTGGMKNVDTLSRTNSLIDMIKKLDNKKKILAAICAAPIILAKAGVLEDKKATIYPGMERGLPKPRDEKIVVDGNVITSQGPGTALEFALKIVEILKGQLKAEQIRKDIIA